MNRKQWVRPRVECNPQVQYEKLTVRVLFDILEFNEILKKADSDFTVLPGENVRHRAKEDFDDAQGFLVYPWHGQGSRWGRAPYVEFTPEKDRIDVLTINKKELQIVPTWVAEKRECQFDVVEGTSETRYRKLWQVSSMVLSPLFGLILSDDIWPYFRS